MKAPQTHVIAHTTRDCKVDKWESDPKIHEGTLIHGVRGHAVEVLLFMGSWLMLLLRHRP